MCEPVSIGLMAASAVAGGMAKKNAADAQADAANQNRKLEHIKAQQSIQKGHQEAAIAAQHQLQQEGNIRASAAARGVVVDAGSAAVGVQDAAAAGARDRANIMMDARRESLAHTQEAKNLAAERENLQAGGKAALFGSVLSAAGKVAGAWSPAPDAAADGVNNVNSGQYGGRTTKIYGGYSGSASTR